jgi:4-carboxymuconolactone decarboxylase
LSGSRHPVLDEARLSPEQREIYDAIVAGPRGEVVGPLRVWLQSPDLARHAQSLGAFARYGTELPPVLSELAILVTARLWSSGFEWRHHAPIAARAGLPQDVIDAIGEGRRPAFDDPVQRAVFDTAVELHRDRSLTDETYAAALDALGLKGLVELVGICGYYTLISMTINVFDVPQGEGPPLPDPGIAPERMFRDA